jgi:Skp family chaperone for outer membrane proteins
MIKSTRRIALLAALLTLGVAGSHATAQTATPAAPAASGAKILVVSMDKVFAGSDENTAFVQKRNARVAEIQSAAKMRAAKLEELQTKLQGMVGESNFQNSAFESAAKEFEQAQIDAKIADELAQREVDRMQKMNLRSISQKVDKEIEAVARDMGAVMVLNDVRPSIPEAGWAVSDFKTLAQAVGGRTLLYVSPDANVTEQVTMRLNDSYKKAGAIPASN